MELTAAPAVVRKLNELYKASVLSCQGLSLRLQRFLLDKQRLLDRIQSVTAEKLIFSHAVHTVGGGAAALGRAVMARGTPAPQPSRLPGPGAAPATPSQRPGFPHLLNKKRGSSRRDRGRHPAQRPAPQRAAAEVLGSFRPRAASASVPVPAGFRLHS